MFGNYFSYLSLNLELGRVEWEQYNFLEDTIQFYNFE